MSANQELLSDFVLESVENIQNAHQSLSLLEHDSKDRESLNAVYRCIHTLKSSASLLGFVKTQELAHLVESALDLVREGILKFTPEFHAALLLYADKTYEQLKSIEVTGKESINFSDEMKEHFLSIVERSSSTAFVSPLPSLGLQEDFITTSSDSKLNIVEVSKSPQNALSPEGISPALVQFEVGGENENEAKVDGHPAKLATESTIRVNVNLLDKIMNKVGELVLNRNQILQFTNDNNHPFLVKLAQELNIITTELQTDIMTTRMQPIGTVLSKFERVVRDYTRESGKKIRLKLHGVDTELDKSLIEMIKDPLTHIVRNAMDHGLESTQERLASGKNEEGTIIIKAYHESGQVTVEIQDDGRGLNKEKIIAKAIEKALVSAEEIKNYTDERIYNLVFAPGFSTAEKVTKVSGRGVGMDVVKTNVEKMGGTIHLSSELGKYSTVKLKIPLTLAIIPALTVKSSKEIFAIPQTNIEELVRYEENFEENVERILKSEFIRLRGKLIPIFRLNDILNLKSARKKSLYNQLVLSRFNDIHLEEKFLEKNISEAIQSLENDIVQSVETNIVILNAEGVEYGLVVDEILDTEEIVVKPLEKFLATITHFAGATIMGNGDIALIIDALGFYNSVRFELSDVSTFEVEDGSKDALDLKDIHENLLFQLSDKRVYSVPLSLISRLEEISSDRVEQVGDSLVVKYNNKPMVLIELDRQLKLIESSRKEKTKLKDNFHVLVVTMMDHVYGLIVDEILDISITKSSVDSDIIDRPGFLGTLYIEGKIVTLLNIHQIIDDLHLGEKINVGSKPRLLIQNKTLLVVEDSPVYRKMEVDTFKALGFKVLSAVNGLEGLEMMQASGEKIDIVVTDIEMPKMNGFQFCESLRKVESFVNLPVIAISTKVTNADREKGKLVGFTQHLEKFKREEVIEVVTSYFKEGK